MKIDIRLNGIKTEVIETEDPISIQKVLQDTDIDSSSILSYKINHTLYVNDEYTLDRDTLVNCITYNHPEGYRIYQDATIFIMSKAMYSIFGREHSVVVEHSIGDGVFCELFNAQSLSEQDCARIKQEMLTIVENDIPIERIEVKPEEAIDIFSSMGRKDMVKNIKYLYNQTVPIYKCGKYYDSFIRPLADRTGMIREFELVYQAPGFILRFPTGADCKIATPFVLPKKLFGLHQEHDKWLDILRVHNILDINKLIDDYEVSQFILVEEALHEKKIAEIASDIVKNQDTKLVLIAGPSSSGKTTFAKRLSVQLQASKATPIVIGMDDYFVDRTHTPRKENGDYDFESIYSLDLEFLNQQLTSILRGDEVELPQYDFSRGVRKRSNNKVKLKEHDIIIMEGIHGLNEILTESIPSNRKVKIYISALNQLNIDNHNRIPTTDCRLIRRIVRDHQYRGYSADETLMRWNDVRAGEESNIFPYQENADFMFNSSLTFELGVLKKHVWRLLQNVPRNSSAQTEAKRLMTLLSHVKDIPDSLVPYNSLIREFTNGSIFKY
ncbi:MAG: nucleoside kinase [Candidatus Cloacimonetes bacterium HGW-Cloacimonetes-1]|jgi:uridine kinase|nr:MAG: nucleoside kinase [Candidatus Cloacimonetes bacterium HGW-Cloacimonetes-1]